MSDPVLLPPSFPATVERRSPSPSLTVLSVRLSVSSRYSLSHVSKRFIDLSICARAKTFTKRTLRSGRERTLRSGGADLIDDECRDGEEAEGGGARDEDGAGAEGADRAGLSEDDPDPVPVVAAHTETSVRTSRPQPERSIAQQSGRNAVESSTVQRNS